MNRPGRPPVGLVDRRAVLQGSAAMAIGVVLLVAAYVGADGRETFSAQVGSLNLAVLGSTLAAVGQGSLLLRGRRALGLRRKAITHGALAELAGPTRTSSRRSARVPGLVVVSGGTRRHRADCLLVRGKDPQPVSADLEHADCEVCLA